MTDASQNIQQPMQSSEEHMSDVIRTLSTTYDHISNLFFSACATDEE